VRVALVAPPKMPIKKGRVQALTQRRVGPGCACLQRAALQPQRRKALLQYRQRVVDLGVGGRQHAR
jgi:hypothetical protein